MIIFPTDAIPGQTVSNTDGTWILQLDGGWARIVNSTQYVQKVITTVKRTIGIQAEVSSTTVDRIYAASSPASVANIYTLNHI